MDRFSALPAINGRLGSFSSHNIFVGDVLYTVFIYICDEWGSSDSDTIDRDFIFVFTSLVRIYYYFGIIFTFFRGCLGEISSR